MDEDLLWLILGIVIAIIIIVAIVLGIMGMDVNILNFILNLKFPPRR